MRQRRCTCGASASYRCYQCRADVCRQCTYIEKAGLFTSTHACEVCYSQRSDAMQAGDVQAVIARAQRKQSESTPSPPVRGTAARLIADADLGILTSEDSPSADAEFLVQASDNPTFRHMLSPPVQKMAGLLIAEASSRGAHRA
mmetsp:Transcript_13158/g.34284  ORF Transcript_13158/g.34284 Transcript_13158/m.34284 type:complete len:144 (-) Transcript_13158:237-668(-)